VNKILLVCAASLSLAVLCGCAGDGTTTQKSGLEASNTASATPENHEGKATSNASDSENTSLTVDLDPVDDSGVRGTVGLTQLPEGVQVELKVGGLPNPKAEYFARVHEGTCVEAGGIGNDHQHGGVGSPMVALVSPDQRILSKVFAFAHPGHKHDDTEKGAPNFVDVTILVTSSTEGRGVATALLQGVTVDQLTSGSPKSIALVRSSDSGAPSPLACSSLSRAT
jgi:hypothetical protein